MKSWLIRQQTRSIYIRYVMIYSRTINKGNDMRSCYFSAFLLTIFLNVLQICAQDPNPARIQWLTHYEDAVNQSIATNKPVLMFFTGSGWCTWCDKLEEEVFETREFHEAAGDKFIFLKVDYPKKDSSFYMAMEPQVKEQNKQLLSRFNIRSYPTVIVLDGRTQHSMGITGYRAGGPRQYASHLQRIVSDYASYKQQMGSLSTQKVPSDNLKRLYEKANELDLDDDINRIVKAGMVSDNDFFFKLERYRYLAEEGAIHDPEAVALRQQLLAADSDNSRKAQYQIAVIEFEEYSEENNYSPEKAVAPLVSYIEKFGNRDKENVWRLQMIISQVYLDHNKFLEALKYAQSSYDSAPAAVQPEIALTISNMRRQVR